MPGDQYPYPEADSCPAHHPSRSAATLDAPVAVEVNDEAQVESTATERAALYEPASDPVAATRELVSVLSSATDDEQTVPIYLKPLEWLNAPLAACPESVRDLLGKAAIITLANAIAVLVYVLMFRKH